MGALPPPLDEYVVGIGDQTEDEANQLGGGHRRDSGEEQREGIDWVLRVQGWLDGRLRPDWRRGHRDGPRRNDPSRVHSGRQGRRRNAASIDDSATDTVKGTCFSETNAHFSPAGWVDDSTRQACLFGPGGGSLSFVSAPVV